MIENKILYINYSDNKFKKSQDYACSRAKKYVRNVIAYSPDDLDQNFISRNKNILSLKKGGGMWLWKPYIVDKALKEINDGDFLFYCDSGAFPIRNIDILARTLSSSSQDIMGFELPFIEYQWTKEKLFINLECNENRFTHTNQILASFFLIRKSDFSVSFIKEWLDHCVSNDNILDDSLNSICIEHRHDQSVFSLLYKKYNLIPFKDPSQFGLLPELYAYNSNIKCDFNKPRSESNYGVLLFHKRKETPLIGILKFLIKYIVISFKKRFFL